MTSSFDTQTLSRRLHELLLLSALRRAPMHGYQIALDIERRSGGFFNFNHGTLYPILHRLEKDGLITGNWSGPQDGRPKKEYSLTAHGRKALRALRQEWSMLHHQLGTLIDDDDEQVRSGAA